MFVAGLPYTPANEVSPGAVLSNCGALLDISRLTVFWFLAGATVPLSCVTCTCTSLCVAGCSAPSSAEQHTHPSQNARIRAHIKWVSVAVKVRATSSFFCVSTVCRPRQDRMEKPHRATWFIKHNWARYKRRYRRCRRIVLFPHAAASSQVCFESLPSTSF